MKKLALLALAATLMLVERRQLAEVALAIAKSGLVEVMMFSLNPAFDRVQAGKSPWVPAKMDRAKEVFGK